MTLDSVSALNEFYALLDTLRGLDMNNAGLSRAQMHGTIRIVRVGEGENPVTATGEQIAAWTERYPSITVIPERIENHVYYYNYNGSELLYDETVYNNMNATYNGIPMREPSGGYMYSFQGWSVVSGSATADAVLTNVTESRTVYAAYVRAPDVAPTLVMKTYSTGAGVTASVQVTDWGAYPRLRYMISTDENGDSFKANVGSEILNVIGNMISITPTADYYDYALTWILTFFDESGSAKCDIPINLKNIPTVTVMKKATGEKDTIVLNVASFGRYPNVTAYGMTYIYNDPTWNKPTTGEPVRTVAQYPELFQVSENTVTLTARFLYRTNDGFVHEAQEVISAFVEFSAENTTGSSRAVTRIPLDMFEISAPETES